MKENLFSVRGMVGRLPVITMPMLSDERWQELTKAPVPMRLSVVCKVDGKRAQAVLLHVKGGEKPPWTMKI